MRENTTRFYYLMPPTKVTSAIQRFRTRFLKSTTHVNAPSSSAVFPRPAASLAFDAASPFCQKVYWHRLNREKNCRFIHCGTDDGARNQTAGVVRSNGPP